MARTPPCRKILVFETEPSIHNVLCFLLAGLGYQGGVAQNEKPGLAAFSRDSFDTVLLDLRCSGVPPDHNVSHIKEIRPSLVGRVLVLTGEVRDPRTIDVIERECTPRLARKTSVKDLLHLLRADRGQFQDN